MPQNLHRYFGRGDLHYITFSCYHRLPLLSASRARDLFVRVLDEVRKEYGFKLAGYVVMPEHVHLLIGESVKGNPSTLIQILKLRVSKRLRGRLGRPSAQMDDGFQVVGTPQFWQSRFYDFSFHNVAKLNEKLDYIHLNPVTRELVSDPKDWAWSSYASYSGRGRPLIKIDFI